MASSEEDDVMDNAPDGDEDLFGGEDEDEQAKTRELSDRELDSGDDEDRNDRAPQEEEIDYEGGRDARIMESTVWRHPLPKPVDGEVSSTGVSFERAANRVQFSYLRLPKFLGIEPRVYDAETFRIPEADHHSDTRAATFSASAVSASTMRFRKNPSTGKLESNTNVYRWSDGSTTISVGDQHYELQSKPLAPPKDTKSYSETHDSHYYLASPSIASQLLLLVGHMSNHHTVRPNEAVEDDALDKLQKSLAAAARRGNKNEKGPELITNTQDPELQKKRAELAEKERMRAQRRRETAAEKASQSHRPGARSGGLSLDDLEGRGRRAPTSGRKPPKPRKRRPDYDSDDDRPAGRGREDEYDLEDDFLAPSDDEDAPEGDDDEEEEEILDDESDREVHKSKKQKTSRHEEVSDADADAEADLDDEEAPAAQVVTEAAGRGRKRNIIEDDDDE